MGIEELPKIGVSGPDRRGTAAWIFTSRAITRAGGIAVRLRPRARGVGQALAKLDGLVLGGGADIGVPPTRRPPARWRQQLLRALRIEPAATFAPDPARDAFELELTYQAERQELPLLGICRGAQLMNIYAGGTLHTSLAALTGRLREPRLLRARKRVRVAPDSKLADVLQRDLVDVNALHQQAVDSVGEQLSCCARDEHGVIQAIESRSRPMWVGVQWHPEYLPRSAPQRRLFRALIGHAAARTRAGSAS